MFENIVEERKQTPLSPTDVHRIVKVCNLTDEFKQQCYVDATEKDLEFYPDVQMVYSHSLALEFLKAKGLPVTIEDLADQEQYIFNIEKMQSFTKGDVVIFNDYGDNLCVIEVLENFEMSDEREYISNTTGLMEDSLKDFVKQGFIKIHPFKEVKTNSHVRWRFENKGSK